MRCDNVELIPVDERERLVAALLRRALRLALKPVLSPVVPLALQRWWLKQLTRGSSSRRLARVEPGRIGGVGGEWVRPHRACAKAAVLYLHGGAYCIGSPRAHRALTCRLADAAGLPVFAAGYRLAPEHPFPAAVDDALSTYRTLAASGPVVLAGDSAGGGLAVAAALAAQDQRIEAPAALVLLSPWVDLSLAALPDKAGKLDAMLSARWLAACAHRYLAGADAAAPLASPIYGDLHGLPPTLIQVGRDELLHGDAVRLHGALRKAGVAAACEIIADRWHVFQFHAGILPSAQAAIERAGRFISGSVTLQGARNS